MSKKDFPKLPKVLIGGIVGVGLIGLGIFGFGGITFKKSVVEIKANEVAFSINNFSKVNEKQGGDKSQKLNNTREYWQTIRETQKMVTIPYQRISTGAIPVVNSKVIPSQKIITVSQSPVSREWVAEKDKGTSTKSEALKGESRDGAVFQVGVVASARITDPELYLSVYGTKLDAKLEDVKVESIPLEHVMDTIIKPYIVGRIQERFGSVDTIKIQPSKNEVMRLIESDTRERFLAEGITIISFSVNDSISWEDEKIQEAINKTAILLSQKAEKEAQQKVDAIDAQTKRLLAEEEAKKKASELSIIAEGNANKAKQEQIEQATRNQTAIDKAKADAQIATISASTLDVELKKAEIARKQAETRAIELNATALLEQSKKWNGVQPGANATTVGASSVVDTNGKVQLLNLTK